MTATIVRREAWLDRARGLAVVLMVVDHLAVFLVHEWGNPAPYGGLAQVLRLTVTRASLVLFMLVAGWLIEQHGARPRRMAEICLAGAAVTAFGWWLDFPIGRPDVLLLIGVCLCFWRQIRRHPVAAIALGVVQLTAWPIPWSGYQPGAVLALLAAGIVWNCRAFAEGGRLWTQRLPSWLGWPGRHALGLYVAHIAALGVVEVVRGS